MLSKHLSLILLVCTNLFAQQIVVEPIQVSQSTYSEVAINQHGELYVHGCFAQDVVVLNAQGENLGTLPRSCKIDFGVDRFAVVCGAHDKRHIFQDFTPPAPSASYTIDPLYDTPDSNHMVLSLNPQATALVNDFNEIFVYYPIQVYDSNNDTVVFGGVILKKYSSSGKLLLRKKFESSFGYLYEALLKAGELSLRFESQIYNLDGQLNILSHTSSPINSTKYTSLIELPQGGWLGVSFQQDSLLWLDSDANVKATVLLSGPKAYKRLFLNRSGNVYMTNTSQNGFQLSSILLQETVTSQSDLLKSSPQVSKSEMGYQCSEGIVEVQLFDVTGRMERHHTSQFISGLKGKLIMLVFDAAGNVHRQYFTGF